MGMNLLLAFAILLFTVSVLLLIGIGIASVVKKLNIEL